MQRIEQTLEMKYWDYLEFYMSVLSKAIHLSSTGAFNPYIVFHNVNVQQMWLLPFFTHSVETPSRRWWTR